MAEYPDSNLANRWLTIDEVRLITDLRLMHAKVDELYRLVLSLRERHAEQEIQRYSDPPVLTQDISRVDEIYLWFVKLREQLDNRAAEE